jgi:hypothetical protein
VPVELGPVKPAPRTASSTLPHEVEDGGCISLRSDPMQRPSRST